MPKAKTDAKRVNLYLPTKHVDIAKGYAARKGMSFSELMRTALLHYLRAERDRLLAAKENTDA
jgi:hypothetical protein